MSLIANQAPTNERLADRKPGEYRSAQDNERPARDASEKTLREDLDASESVTSVHRTPPPAYFQSQYGAFLDRVKRRSAYAKTTSNFASTFEEQIQQDGEEAIVESQYLREYAGDDGDPLNLQLREVPRPASGTHGWVLKSRQYTRVKEQPGIFIFLAQPGLGKTVLAKGIHEDLQATNNELTVISFFCKRKVAGRSSALAVIATFLYRLLQDKDVENFLHQRYMSSNNSLSDGHITGLLSGSEMTLDFEKLWHTCNDIGSQKFATRYALIIDGLDECTIESQRELANALRSIPENYRFRLFITSRKEPAATMLATSFPRTTINAKISMFSEDVEIYVNERLHRLGLRDDAKADLARNIKHQILERSESLFLLISCRLDEVETRMNQRNLSTNVTDLEQLLNQPFAPVFKYFAEMLDETIVTNQSESGVEILNLVLAAQDRLTEAELSVAYAFARSEFLTQDEFNLHRPQDIFFEAKLRCGSIVQIQHSALDDLSTDHGPPDELSTIDIVHDQAREFLENNHMESLIPQSPAYIDRIGSIHGHVMMAIACMRYLLFESATEDTESKDIKFLFYALVHWPTHVGKAGSRVVDFLPLLATFLSNTRRGYFLWTFYWSSTEKYQTGEDPGHQPIAHTIVEYRLNNVLDVLEKLREHDCPIDLDERSKSGRTALWQAVARGEFDIAEQLLELHADPKVADENGVTPVHLAALRGQLSLITKLKEKGADVDAITTYKHETEERWECHAESPLWWSLYCSSYPPADIFKHLRSLGARKTTRSDDQWPIVLGAASTGDVKTLKFLLRDGHGSIQDRSPNGITALMVAACHENGHAMIDFILTETNLDVDATTDDNKTAFWLALRDEEHKNAVRLLRSSQKIEIAVGGDHIDPRGWTPLHLCAASDYRDIGRELIHRGADKNALTNTGASPLLIAIEYEKSDFAQMLMHKLADVDHADDNGTFPLLGASIANQLKVVNALIQAKANTMASKGGITALHMAAWQGHLEVAQSLIQARKLLNESIDEVERKSGYTPLMCSLRQNKTNVAQILLNSGSDTGKVSSSGLFPLHFACWYTKDETVLDFLLSKIPAAFADRAEDYIDASTNSGSTPLHFAASNGFEYAVKCLIEHDADVSARSDSAQTPLMLAADSGTKSVIDMILELDACMPDARDKEGWTALHFACRNCKDYDVMCRLMNVTNWQRRKRSTATPINLAVALQNKPAMKALLDNGMPPDFVSDDGHTPLYEAVDFEFDSVEPLLQAGAQKDVASAYNIAPYVAALEHRDEQVIQALKPSNFELLTRRANTILTDSVFLAARYDGETVKWLLENGLPPNGRAWSGENALHSAAESSNWRALDVLLDFQPMIPMVDCVANISRRSPLILAAQSRSPQCVEVLIRKGHANSHLKDLLGFSALDYAWKHKATRETFQKLDLPAYEAWTEEPWIKDDFRRNRLRFSLIWLKTFSKDDQYYSHIKRNMIELISAMLFPLKDEENGMTALESIYGTPSKYREGFLRCIICLTWKRRSGFICSECPYFMFCAECESDEEKMMAFGCNEHKRLRFPRETWASRDPLYVNDMEQTEEDWMKNLFEKYDVKSLEEKFQTGMDDGDDSGQIHASITEHLKISWSYAEERKNVFELCWDHKWNELKAHLLWYPRDVSLQDAKGDNMALYVLRHASEDEECLRVLEMLNAEAVAVLFRSAQSGTTIDIACEKDFVRCLTFILSIYDRQFNLIDDKNSEHVMKKMIERGWDDALNFAIDRHFDWASQGSFEYLHQVDRLGLDTIAMIRLIKEVHSVEDTPPTPIEQPHLSLTAFEQPQTGNLPYLRGHYLGCLHQQCREGYVDEGLKATGKSQHPSAALSAPVLQRTNSMQETGSVQSFSSNSDDLSITDKVAFLCGLAGLFPDDRGSILADSINGLHTASISYAHRNDEASDLSTSIEILLRAGTGLMEAMFCTQSANMCCDLFTVLCEANFAKGMENTSLIELCRIPFEAVLTFVQDIKGNAQQVLNGSSETLLSKSGFSALDTIKAICYFSIIPRPSALRDQVHESAQMMQFLCLGFCSYLWAHSSSLVFPVVSSILPPVILEGMGGSSRIAFRPRKLACIGDMLGVDVSVFCQAPGAFDYISEEPVQKCSVLARADDLLEIWGPGQCLFKKGGASRTQVFAIALRHGFLALSNHSTITPRRAHWYPTSMVDLMRPGDGSTKEKDWKLPIRDGGFMSGQEFLSGNSELYDQLLTFSADELLQIGGSLEKNLICDIRNKPERQVGIYEFERRGERTCYLGSFLPSWTVRNIQANVGIQAPHIGISGAIGFDKLTGNSKKAEIVRNLSGSRSPSTLNPCVWRDEDFGALKQPYGVIFSICSNFAQRVPLREALAEAWPMFTVDWSSDWKGLREVIQARLKGERPNYVPFGQNYDPEYELRWLITHQNELIQMEIRKVIIEILGTLSFTGVARDGKTFRIAWPQMDDPRAGYEFKCSEVQAGWVRLLQDTGAIVTFAIVTNDCLVYHQFQDRECVNQRQEVVRLKALQLLDTKIIEENVSSADWQLPNACVLTAAGPPHGRSIGNETKVACEVVYDRRRREYDLVVMGDAVIMGRVYSAASRLGHPRWMPSHEGITKRMHEVGYKPHLGHDWSRPVVVTQYTDWRFRPLWR